MRARWLIFLFCLGAAASAAGRISQIRCLDVPDLLEQSASSQEGLLDKARAAGFNSVSFSAPLYGPKGFSAKLGALENSRINAFRRLVGGLEKRGLRGFPLLWDAQAMEAFGRAGGGSSQFFIGSVQNQWQVWLLKSLVKASSVGKSPGIAGWILIRTEWPGLHPGAQSAVSNAVPNAWLAAGRAALRDGGATQPVGMGILLGPDFPNVRQDNASFEVSAPDQDTPPLAPRIPHETILPDEVLADKLPPLPRDGDKIAAGLAGIDWTALGSSAKELAQAANMEFTEWTFDSEDWRRVGAALASVARNHSPVPMIWRQDWRVPSRYERRKHLNIPNGLAGLSGPWPDEDWPDAEETIWPEPARAKKNRDL
ncbi:MAG: hypothetical protein V4498_10295 [candidate division FCPU426 bacterium]